MPSEQELIQKFIDEHDHPGDKKYTRCPTRYTLRSEQGCLEGQAAEDGKRRVEIKKDTVYRMYFFGARHPLDMNNDLPMVETKIDLKGCL